MAKKPGRPRKDTKTPRLPRVVIEVTEEEKALLERAAEIDERPTSIWARRLLLDAARREIAAAGD